MYLRCLVPAMKHVTCVSKMHIFTHICICILHVGTSAFYPCPALEIFLLMRYINLRLLTYLLGRIPVWSHEILSQNFRVKWLPGLMHIPLLIKYVNSVRREQKLDHVVRIRSSTQLDELLSPSATSTSTRITLRGSQSSRFSAVYQCNSCATMM